MLSLKGFDAVALDVAERNSLSKEIVTSFCTREGLDLDHDERLTYEKTIFDILPWCDAMGYTSDRLLYALSRWELFYGPNFMVAPMFRDLNFEVLPPQNQFETIAPIMRRIRAFEAT